jgi:hypothetical protein
MREDLPTLLLPMNAYSGLSGFGHLSNEGAEIIYFADLICIVQNKESLTDILRALENTRVILFRRWRTTLSHKAVHRVFCFHGGPGAVHPIGNGFFLLIGELCILVYPGV